MYHDREHTAAQTGVAVWHSVAVACPLDCCARPDFARQQPAVLTQYQSVGQRMRTLDAGPVRLLWRGQRQPTGLAIPMATGGLKALSRIVRVPRLKRRETWVEDMGGHWGRM
jgi:hypothetical protein